MRRTVLAGSFCWMIVGLALAKGVVPAEVLSAYATSSSKDSTSVMALLDGSGQGAWSPESKDFGANEGIYVQFATPVLVDYIDITLRGKFDMKALGIHCYLDGKSGLPNQEKVEFRAVPLEKTGAKSKKGREQVYRVYQVVFQRGGNQWDHNVPLHSNIRSFYFKFDTWHAVATKGSPIVTSIRFAGPKGDIPLVLPKMVPAEVKASSVLGPYTAYQPGNLFDSRPDFSWSTDGKKNDGVGETLDLAFDEAQDLSGLMVWNGYQRSETHYGANGRVSQLEVTSDKGGPQTIQLKDRYGAQEVAFPSSLSGSHKLHFKILSVYPGDRYKDVLISELRFRDADHRLVQPLSGVSVPQASETARTYLDRTWSSALGGGPGIDSPANSLRLRSNGTFVLYQTIGAHCDGGCEDKRVEEGNWEFTDGNFHIFGKKYTLTFQDSVYIRAQGTQETFGIFQSPLTITTYRSIPEKVRGDILRAIKGDSAYGEWDKGILFWSLSDQRSKPIFGKSTEELLANVDKYLLTIQDLVHVQGRDVNEVMAPNDTLDFTVVYE